MGNVNEVGEVASKIVSVVRTDAATSELLDVSRA